MNKYDNSSQREYQYGNARGATQRHGTQMTLSALFTILCFLSYRLLNDVHQAKKMLLNLLADRLILFPSVETAAAALRTRID